MPNTSVDDVVSRIENAEPLDAPSGLARRAVQAVLRAQVVRDALNGVWLGHPVHPTLTDVPLGAWTSAAVLDAVPGEERAARLLIAVGLAAAVPTAVTGWADWADLHEQQQRVGIVHAGGIGIAVGCYAASLAARGNGRPAAGRAWAYAGYAVAGVAGYLGGHLSFRQAAGVNHAEAVPHQFPTGWQTLCPVEELPDGELVRQEHSGVGIALMRRGRHIDALADTCSHLAASLAEGEFTVEGGQGCVVCPWHGSTFRLSDGGVVHGPATAPAPRFEVRAHAGEVQVRLPGAG